MTYAGSTAQNERIRELHLCWKCLRTDDVTEQCSKKKCFHCSGSHNSPLCPENAKQKHEKIPPNGKSIAHNFLIQDSSNQETEEETKVSTIKNEEEIVWRKRTGLLSFCYFTVR